jgi:exopolyphosphatase/guanosine-5'-triphosphate,3'-diphosphate pyrophosphatase
MTLCAAIDIGSNTTRLLVAEPVDGQLKKVMEQRAYTRIGKAVDKKGAIRAEKVEEVGEVVGTQVRLAQELGAKEFRAVATAAMRDATNGESVAEAVGEAAGIPIEILPEEEEGRLSFIGATKTLGHPSEGLVGVVDIGGGSTEVILGTVSGGVQSVRSWPVGSGNLAEELISSDPPSAAEIRRIRDRIDDIFEDVEFEKPAQAVAVGGSATSLRRLVGAVLEYETLERGIRVLSSDPAVDVGRRFELDPTRVRILPTGVLLLEKVSDLLGQPLQIGKGGLREGVILDLLSSPNRHAPVPAP